MWRRFVRWPRTLDLPDRLAVVAGDFGRLVWPIDTWGSHPVAPLVGRASRGSRSPRTGPSYLEQGQHRRAIRAVSKIREGAGPKAEALTIRGLAEASRGGRAGTRDLEHAWRLQPNAAAARVLAAIYLSAIENERGLQMLLNASRLDPKDFRPWYAMGELVYLRLRRYELAIAAFQKALDRQPGHLESRVGLADALVKLHRSEEAEPILQGVLKSGPTIPGS